MSLIQIENIKKVFSETETPVTALDNVSVTIEKGSFVSFIGPSGSGKTTLLNLIGALDKPSEGRIVFNNVEISTLDRIGAADFRAEHLGFVFQNFNLLPVLTAYENVEYPLLVLKNTSVSERRRQGHVLGVRDRRFLLRCSPIVLDIFAKGYNSAKGRYVN
ncbi:unnamed protein product [marine sediment metagenome]|uniref:ABC transporter domain-containing protein n=1 Tax=marine sediment metagenome TaxID=412755 RepID=X1J2Y4_9ZZZZ